MSTHLPPFLICRNIMVITCSHKVMVTPTKKAQLYHMKLSHLCKLSNCQIAASLHVNISTVKRQWEKLCHLSPLELKHDSSPFYEKKKTSGCPCILNDNDLLHAEAAINSGQYCDGKDVRRQLFQGKLEHPHSNVTFAK